MSPRRFGPSLAPGRSFATTSRIHFEIVEKSSGDILSQGSFQISNTVWFAGSLARSSASHALYSASRGSVLSVHPPRPNFASYSARGP